MTISTIIFFSGKPGFASTTKRFLFRNPRATYRRENKLEARPSSDPFLMPVRVFLILREIGNGGWISFRSAGCFRNFRVPHSSGCLLFFFSLSLSPGHIRNACFNYCAVYAVPEKFIPPVHARSVRPLDKAEKPRFSFLTLSKFFALKNLCDRSSDFLFFFFRETLADTADICRRLIWKF